MVSLTKCDVCGNESKSDKSVEPRPYCKVLMYGGNGKDIDLCKECIEFALEELRLKKLEQR